MSKTMKSSRKKRTSTSAAVAVEPTAMPEATVEHAAASPLAEDSPTSLAPAEPVLVLASNCGVKDAAALKASLCALAAGERATLDVSNLERVDTAAMQLLCAFVRERKSRGQPVNWQGESAALRDAVRLLGLGDLLELSAPVAGAAA
jgi:ABC-type transporter Mla MlaB component